MIIRIHYNTSGKGLPWRLRTDEGLFEASHVDIYTHCSTEENPNLPSHPKYFIKCEGDIHWYNDRAAIFPVKQ